MTALGASLLVAITIILTVSSRSTERQFRSLVEHNVAEERALTEMSRLLGSWQRRWVSLPPDSSAKDIEDLAVDLRSITTAGIDRSGSDKPWTKSLTDLDARVSTVAERWPSMSIEERIVALRRVAERTSAVNHRLSAFERAENAEIETRIDTLSRQTRDTVWVSLAIVWIIAIVSFAVARRTLDKVVVPLERLAEASRKLSAGDLEARAPVGGDLEIVTLGAAFNEMAESLTKSNRALAERARTDELTGLPNYRAFSEALEAEIERSLRYDYSFGLVLIDVDHFKQYNDTYGHQAGNEALRMVATRIEDSIRSIDTAARFGGEEIALILPRVDMATLRATAERVRRSIENEPGIGTARQITVSIGGALFPDSAGTAERLFEVADAMLYRAKNAGRNRTEIDDSERVVQHPQRGRSRRRG